LSTKGGCRTIEELDQILHKSHIEPIVEFFGLPNDYYNSRKYDGGTCRDYETTWKEQREETVKGEVHSQSL
jgi:hypothetical protein